METSFFVVVALTYNCPCFVKLSFYTTGALGNDTVRPSFRHGARPSRPLAPPSSRGRGTPPPGLPTAEATLRRRSAGKSPISRDRRPEDSRTLLIKPPSISLILFVVNGRQAATTADDDGEPHRSSSKQCLMMPARRPSGTVFRNGRQPTDRGRRRQGSQAPR